jgi:excisionase family DNA binding protein
MSEDRDVSERATQEPVPRFCLSPKEAAFALGLSRSAIFRLLAAGPERGGLRSLSAGKRRLVPVTEISRWIEERAGSSENEK